ncbi:MAG: DUF4335 domain-containing protein [Pseudanabaenaceae cyanobacterium]
MPLFRTYNTPNCALEVEGIAAGESPQQVSILTHFACRFFHVPVTIAGGKELLQQLATAVATYTQGVLTAGWGEESLGEVQVGAVHLAAATAGTHRLRVKTEDGAEPYEVLLDTVQLFDLQDSLDRLGLDPETLPDVVPVLPALQKASPLLRRGRFPLAAMAGALSVVVAAVALSWLPVPEPVEEKGLEAPPVPTQPAATGPDVETRPDPETVNRLRQDLFLRLDRAWRNPITFGSDAVFIVTVNTDGAIVKYEPTAETEAIARGRVIPLAEELPLKSLLAETTDPKPTVAFRVVFRVNEQLVVEPIAPQP